MDDLLRDLRFAVRTLLNKPGFTLVALVSLALGIGANTLVFTLVNELFLRPLAIHESDRVVSVHSVVTYSNQVQPVSHLNWLDLREQNEVFTGLAAYDWCSMSVSVDGEGVYTMGQMVSGDYFDVLGVRPALGRTFLPEEDEAEGSFPVVVVSHAFWSERLGADPGVVGRTIRVNAHPFTVIGVMPPAFRGLEVGLVPELWVPMAMNRVIRANPMENFYHGNRAALVLMAFGRLRDGLDVKTADAQLKTLGERLASDHPEVNGVLTYMAEPINSAVLPARFRSGAARGASLLLAMVGLVLLIACLNLANLLLARASERRREIAVRLALGVGRGRLIRQLMTESLLVALLGGALGLALAATARGPLVALFGTVPFHFVVTLAPALDFDPPVLTATLAVSVLTGLLLGLVPAWRSSRPDLAGALVSSTPRRLGGVTASRAMVVAQLALSLVALAGAALFLRSLAEAGETDPGFETERLLAVSLDLALQGYEPPRGENFQRDLVEHAAALPGVVSAALAQAAPMQYGWGRRLDIDGFETPPGERIYVPSNVVSPGYFETLGIPVEAGRVFRESDRGRGVAVVNRVMAERFWGGDDALGKLMRVRTSATDYRVEVIGIVPAVDYFGVDEAPQPFFYMPLSLEYRPAVTLLARTESDPGPILKTVEREIRALDPELPLARSVTISQLLSDALWAPRLAAAFLGVFGLVALVLAAVGVYGVMSYSVARRTREIGIRMALGAERGRVFAMVLGQSLVLLVIGVGLGLAVVLVTAPGVEAMLFVSPMDPLAFAVTIGVLVVVALVASLVPAGRAVSVDPVRVLRYE